MHLLTRIATALCMIVPQLVLAQPDLLQANPGFENASTMANWVRTGTGTNSRTGTGRRSGAAALQITGLSAAAFTTVHNVQHSITVPATGTYFLTVVAYARGAGNTVSVAVDAGTTADVDGPAAPGGTLQNIGNTSTRISYTQPAVNGTTYHPVLYARSNGNATVRWDDVHIYLSTNNAADITAPAAPTAFTSSMSGSVLSFNFTQGNDNATNRSGIAGVTILRNTGAQLLNGNVTLNGQTHYNANTQIGPAVISSYTVVYNGPAVGTFSNDLTGINNASYLIYMRDSALNYTAASGAARLFVVNNVSGIAAVSNQASNTSLDGLYVAAGDTFIISNNSTVTLRAGANCQIDGAIRVNGRLNSGAASRITFKNGSLMQHNASAAAIPLVTATWQSGSTCSVTGYTNTVFAGFTQNFHHFIWNCAAQTNTFTVPATFNVLGNLAVNNSGTGALAFPAGTTYSFRGNMVLNDDVIFNATGTYRFIGNTGVQTISGSTGTTPVFGNLAIATSGSGSVELARDIAVQTTFAINSGAVLNGGSNGSSLIIAGDANFDNNGTYTAGNGKVVFNGNANRKIRGTSATRFNRLIVNNSSVAGLSDRFVTLESNASVGNLLVLQTGGVRTNGRTLTMEQTAIITGSELQTTVTDEQNYCNTDRTSFVALCNEAGVPQTTGGLRRLNMGPGGRTTLAAFTVGFTTPASITQTNFTPVMIQNQGAAADNYTVRSITPDSPPGTSSGSSVDYSYNLLEDVPGGSNCIVRLYWHEYMEGIVFDQSWCAVVHSNGTIVDYFSPNFQSPATATNTPAFWSKQGIGFQNFSPFSVSSSSSILPIVFEFVQVGLQQQQPVIQWRVSSDEEVKYYQIERSTDGVHFTAIGQVNAYRNRTATTYQFSDVQPTSAASLYYRVIAVEVNGSTISKQVMLRKASGLSGISVYPNPVVNHTAWVQLQQQPAGKYSAILTDASGRQLALWTWHHAGASATSAFSMPAAVKGVAYLTISGPQTQQTIRLLIQ